jgi:autotransporter-associated beta strand protein
MKFSFPPLALEKRNSDLPNELIFWRFFRFLGLLFWILSPDTRAQGWSPVPSANFSTVQLSQFADHELEIPYHLNHFAQVANSVVETTTTINGVTYPRGFLNIKVNREPDYNLPHNARILEMQMVLAYFYTANRPWNPYYNSLPVRQRLEAMMSLWVSMQAPDGDPNAGLFTEYSASNWSMAPTSFGAMAAAQALDLIVDSGLPFDATVLNNAKAALRRALLALFTRTDMRNHAKAWSNQFNGAYHATLIYLENWGPDSQLLNAFAKAVVDSAAQDQSPAGFWYEQEGPDFGYSGVHDNNLRVAWPRLRAYTNVGGTNLAALVVQDDVYWNDWLAANFVLQPGISTHTFFTSAGLNTRTSHAFQTPRSRPLSELATNSRAFSYTDTEFAASLTTKRSSEQSRFGNYGTLSVPNAYSYIPAFVYDAARPSNSILNGWHPTAAQRDAELAKLPSRGTNISNRLFHNAAPSSGAISLSTAKRTNYYATFASGNVRVPRQAYGLNLLWNSSFGLALQAVSGSSTSVPWQWGTVRGTNVALAYETGNIPGTIKAGTNTVSPTPGVTNLPSGDLSISYALTSGGTNFGQKSVTLGSTNITVVVTHSNIPGANAFTEYLPLAHASDATLTTNATRLALQRPDGSSFLLQLNSSGATIDIGVTSTLTSGMVRRGVTIKATNTLSYSLTVSDQPPASENSTPSLSAGDAAVVQSPTASTNALLGVTLSAAAGSNVTVSYATANGTAMAGTDYTATNGTLTFSPGETSKNVPVAVLAGQIPQGTSKNFTLKLSTPSGANLARDTGTVTISGTYNPPPSLSIADLTIKQPLSGGSSTNASFTISLSAATTNAVSVSYFTQEGTAIPGVHYQATNGIATFTSGQTNRTVTVPIPPGSLELGQAVEFYVRLSAASGATLADDTARGDILGKNPPPPPPEGSIRIEFVFQNAWSPPSTYQGTFRIINNSTANIRDWRADFDSDVANHNQFTVWNGTIGDSTNASWRYTFTPVSWQANLGSENNTNTTFENLGFQAKPNGDAYYPRNLRLRILSATNTNALTILTASNLGDVNKGSPVSKTLEGGGGIGPYTWTVSPGSNLPAGINLSSDGILSGTVSGSGTNSFNVRMTDMMDKTTNKTLSLNIVSTLSIETLSIFEATAEVPFSQNLIGTGGTEPYSWSLAPGSDPLPMGLSLSAGGVLSGTPQNSGNFNFILQLNDFASGSVTRAYSMSIQASPTLTITTGTSLVPGVVGNAYSLTVAATNGTPPYFWDSISGNLPAGLNLSSGGILSGTPSESGSFALTLRVTDSNSVTMEKNFSLSVAQPLEITSASLPDASAGTVFSANLGSTGGLPPWSWSLISGNLPSGLTLTSAGELTGIPETGGSQTFTVRLTDGSGQTDIQILSLTVAHPLTIATDSLAGGVIGLNYSQSLAAIGGNPPYVWSVISGSLPTGLSLSSSGTISGAPTSAGTSNFTVQVADGTTHTNQSLSITILTPLPLTWDSDGATGGQQNGAGSWNLSNTNWLNGSTNVSWVQGFDAIFGGGTGTAGAIALSNDLTVRHLTFNSTTNGGTYTLTGTNRMLSLGSATSTITANTEGSINVKLAGTNLIKAGSSRLILNNAAYEGNVHVTGELRLIESSNRTWNGAISGGGNLTKYGSGRLTLGASNALTGFFTVTESGSLRVTHPLALGTTNNNTTIQGGANFAGVELDNPAGMTVGESFQLVMHNQSNGTHAQLRNISGSNTISGNLLLNSGGARWDIASDAGYLKITGAVSNIANVASADSWRTLYLTGPGSGELASTIQDTTNGLSKINLSVVSGDWTLSGSNKAYTGNTVVSNGVLRVHTGLSSVIDIKAAGTLAGTGSTSTNLQLTNGSTILRPLTNWASPGSAFTAARVVGSSGTTNWTLRLDGAGLTGFTETNKTVPVLTGALSNITPSQITLVTNNFPGKGSWGFTSTTNSISLVYTAYINPIDTWRDSIPWSGADSSPGADPDGDGIPNLLEYALGGNPLVGGNFILPQAAVQSSRLSFTFARNVAASNLTYTVEASDNFVGWSGIAKSENGGSFTNLGGAQSVSESSPVNGQTTVTVTDGVSAADQSRRFLRLKVLSPP